MADRGRRGSADSHPTTRSRGLPTAHPRRPHRRSYRPPKGRRRRPGGPGSPADHRGLLSAAFLLALAAALGATLPATALPTAALPTVPGTANPSEAPARDRPS